jgi:hypothetical protein
MGLKENGLYMPPSGISEPSYSDYEQSPHVVTRQTAFFLSAYLLDSPNFGPIARHYLTDRTLDYIAQTQQGFHMVFDKTRTMTKEHLEEVIADGDLSLFNPGSQSAEAFRHALVIFAFMPDTIKSQLTSFGYSRRATMSPPETSIDVLQRIRELRNEVSKVISGLTEPLTPVTTTDSLLRTYTFFQTGQELAVHKPKTQNETNDQLRSLLREIKID